VRKGTAEDPTGQGKLRQHYIARRKGFYKEAKAFHGKRLPWAGINMLLHCGL